MKHTFRIPSSLELMLLAFTSTIKAHTWIEQLTVIASNGTFVGTPGYPRGLVDRLPNVDPNAGNVYELPPDGRSTGNAILPTDLMCKSTQMIGNQTSGNPALVASPGDQIALRYQENGHVTQPQLPPGKPEGSGTVFVYGTEEPSNSDTYLDIHRVWNTAGTGGDGRGVLLTTRYFDDGQCYQVNSSPISQARQKAFPHTADALMNEDLWCQTDVQIPTTVSGNYTLYWVWEWPTLDSTGKVTTNQSYTSCMDIVINPSTGTSKAEAVNFATGQSLNYAAVADQMSSQFLVNPTASVQTFISGGPTPTFAGSVAPATSTPAQTTSAGSQSSSVTGGLVTVTVTASANAETVTVTETVNGGASSPAPTLQSSPTSQAPTATYSPVSTTLPSPASSSTEVAAAPQSTSSVPTIVSTIVPFLSPSSSAKASIQESTLSATPTAKLASSPSAVPYTNNTMHAREFKVRGRVVRV